MREIAAANRGNVLFRKLLLALIAATALAGPAAAAEDSQFAAIATMSLKELDALIATVAASVSQDSLKLRSTAQGGNCLDLTRAANSMALGYGYLAEARDTLGKRSERDAQVLLARAIQTRVVTFAARTRAEDWLTQSCRGYVVPAEQADDPRYQPPARIGDAEYTQAIIEARQAAETNLAIAVVAGASDKCPPAMAAAQNIRLLIPYVDKVLNETAGRPQVLGPRASRRALEGARRQLLAALDKLNATFSVKCSAPQPEEKPAQPEEKPAQ